MTRHENLSWLLNEAQLLQVEKSKRKCKEIWIISPDPSNDTGNSPWVEVIRDNINNGITYYYIVPTTDYLDGAINGLKTFFRRRLEKYRILKINMEGYNALPHEHLVLYDPQNQYDETGCFAELDIEEKKMVDLFTKKKHCCCKIMPTYSQISCTK